MHYQLKNRLPIKIANTVICFGFLLFSIFANASNDKPFSLNTERGTKVNVIEQYPSGEGAFPVVILSSGTGYHMHLPLQEKIAAALQRNGFAVFRFDWSYYVADPEKGTPSTDRTAEVEDFNRVLQWVRQQKNLDKKRIILAGKSLGSIISWQVFREHNDIAAAILLTPVCNDRGEIKRSAETLYPQAEKETRPSLWLIGDKDPVCSLSRFYRFAANSPEQVKISVLNGDHSFEGTTNTPETLELAATIATYFATSVVNNPEQALSGQSGNN